MTAETSKKLKIAIHRTPWECQNGHCSRYWPEFNVYVGPNPFGPRGGCCGNVTDAEHVAGRFRYRQHAVAWVKWYLAKHPEIDAGYLAAAINPEPEAEQAAVAGAQVDAVLDSLHIAKPTQPQQQAA